jgi:hypothetical protein
MSEVIDSCRGTVSNSGERPNAASVSFSLPRSVETRDRHLKVHIPNSENGPGRRLPGSVESSIIDRKPANEVEVSVSPIKA